MCTVTQSFQLPSLPPVWGALLAGGLFGYLYQARSRSGFLLRGNLLAGGVCST